MARTCQIGSRSYLSIKALINKDGDWITHRDEWLQMAYDFAKEKYGNILNGVKEQLKRFRIYAARAKASNISVAISPFQCMQAVAKMGMNKGTKQNEVPMEVLKALPFKVKTDVAKHFQRYTKEHTKPPSRQWRTVEHMPLKKEITVQTWQDFRWIGQNDSLRKWYLSSVFDAMPAVPHLPGIQSLGFRESCMVDDVVAIIRELIRGKANDGFTASEIILVVGSQDVLTAFDQVDHEQEAKLLEERGVDL